MSGSLRRSSGPQTEAPAYAGASAFAASRTSSVRRSLGSLLGVSGHGLSLTVSVEVSHFVNPVANGLVGVKTMLQK